MDLLLHHSQKWTIPLMSYDTTYFRLGEGRTLSILFMCSFCVGPESNILVFFSIPESIFDTMPFLAVDWEDFSFFSRY